MADSTEQRLERIEDLLAQCIRELDALRIHLDELCDSFISDIQAMCDDHA